MLLRVRATRGQGIVAAAFVAPMGKRYLQESQELAPNGSGKIFDGDMAKWLRIVKCRGVQIEETRSVYRGLCVALCGSPSTTDLGRIA